MPLEGWRETRLGEVVEPEGGLQTGPFGRQLHASDYVREGDPRLALLDKAVEVENFHITSKV